MADTNLYAAADKLFEAMDIITSKRLGDLKYDKTIVCDIESIENEAEGAYKVTDGATHFIAYSQDITYAVGDRVHVTVPANDMGNQKLIVGKYVAVSKGAVEVFSPLEQMIEVTDNLVLTDNPSSLIANDPAHEFAEVWKLENNEERYVGYDYIGLSFKLKTTLPVNTLNGTYAVVLQVESKTKTGSTAYNRFYITSDELFGNPYRFVTFTRVEHLCDIRDLNEITGMTVYFIQNNDFFDYENIKIPVSLEPNMFIQDLYITLGYDISEVSHEKIILGTFGEAIYGAAGDTGKRDIYMRWIHKDEGRFRSVDKDSEIPSNAVIHWYRYRLETDRKDDLAGDFWKECEVDNLFNFEIEVDNTTNLDGVKAIVEYPSVISVMESLKTDVKIEGLKEEGSKNPLYIALSVDGQAPEDKLDLIKSYSDALLALLNIVNLDTLKEEYEKILTSIAKEETIITKTALLNAIGNIYNHIIGRRQETKYYGTDTELMFQNAVSQVEIALDLIQGLQIEVDQEGRKGIYHLYDEAGEIISISEANRARYLTAKYSTVTTGVADLDAAEEITWYFPADNTMIEFPIEGKEYSTEEGDIFFNQEESDMAGYVAIQRIGSDSKEPLDGETSLIKSNQTFRIKNFYSFTGNNSIICKIKKGGKYSSAKADLIFDVMGNNGTEATFMLKMYECTEENTPILESPMNALSLGNSVMVVPYLYDNTSTELDISEYEVKYGWKEKGTGEDEYGINLTTFGNYAKLDSLSQNIYTHECFILQASIDYKVVVEEKYNEETKETEQVKRNVKLIAYLPIAIAASENFAQINGATKIIYDSMGVKPKYYAKAYKLYSTTNLGEAEEGIFWELYTSEEDPVARPFYPTLNEEYALTANKTYYTGLKPFCIRGLRTVQTVDGDIDEIVWSQPVLYIQNGYGSAMLNDWDGNLTINEKNGTILSAMIGAGNKNDDNTFSGVLMGDMGLVGDSANKSGLGLYGIHHGAQNFGFNVDGTAFIGKSGSGRISFDGNEGTITSGNYEEDVAGMKIDLDDPFLRAYGLAGGFEMDLSQHREGQEDYELLRIFGHHKTFDEDTGEEVSDKIKNLMVVGNNEYYLQSVDFSDESGTRLDLADGKLTGHDFTFLTKTIVKDPAGQNEDLNTSIEISSNGSPYFKIHHAAQSTFEEVEVYETYEPNVYFVISKYNEDGTPELVQDPYYKYEQCTKYMDYIEDFKDEHKHYAIEISKGKYQRKDDLTKKEYESNPEKYFRYVENTWNKDEQYYSNIPVFDEEGNITSYIREPILVIDPSSIYEPNKFYTMNTEGASNGYLKIPVKTYQDNMQYYLLMGKGEASGFTPSYFDDNKSEFYIQSLEQCTASSEFNSSKTYYARTAVTGPFLKATNLTASDFNKNKTNYYLKVEDTYESCANMVFFDESIKYYKEVSEGTYEIVNDITSPKKFNEQKNTLYYLQRHYTKCDEASVYSSDLKYYIDIYSKIEVKNPETWKYYEPNKYYVLSDNTNFSISEDDYNVAKSYYLYDIAGYEKCTVNSNFDSNASYYTYGSSGYVKESNLSKETFDNEKTKYYIGIKSYYPVFVYNNLTHINFNEAKKLENTTMYEIRPDYFALDDLGIFNSTLQYYSDSQGRVSLTVVDDKIYEAIFEKNKYYYKDSANDWHLATEYDPDRTYYIRTFQADGVTEIESRIIKLASEDSTIYKPNTFYVFKESEKIEVTESSKYSANSYYIIYDKDNKVLELTVLDNSALVYKKDTYYILEGEIKYEKYNGETIAYGITYYSDDKGQQTVNLIDVPIYSSAKDFTFSGPMIFNEKLEYYRRYEISGSYILEDGGYDSSKTYYYWNTDNYYPYEAGKYY